MIGYFMGRLCLAGALAILAACQPEPAGEAPLAPEQNEAGTADLPDADINASLGELGAPPLPLERPLRFVGSWATEEAGCATRAWRFTETGLSTPAGSVCRFRSVAQVPGGYDIQASCTAEGPEQEDEIELRFAESAGGMLFESNAIADAGLVRCGSEGG